jgi:hypothetical protein
MWGKYCRIYPEFAQKNNNNALLKVQPIYENWLFDSPRQNEKQVVSDDRCTTN